MEKKETQKTIKTLFKGYIDYDSEEYNKIWKDALIVVDTNILLNLYRYSEDTKKELIKILKECKKRLWVPYQVIKEYFNNRDKVIVSSYDDYNKLINHIKSSIDDAKNEINQKKSKQLKCKDDICKILEQAARDVEQKLKEEMEEKNPKIQEQETEKMIIQLFNNCIGDRFTEEEYEKVKEEGIRRFKEQIPPGYKDAEKEENGDYYIFHDMMKKAKEKDRSIIFVTDDVKEDWFNIINKEKRGGRYELLNEFFKETGNLLLIYTSDGFVQAYNKNIAKQPINEKMIDELKYIRKNKNFYIKQNEPNCIAMLKQYKRTLLYVPELVNYEDIFEELFKIIGKTLSFTEDRFIYERKLLDLRLHMYNLNKDELKEKILSLINELIIKILTKQNQYINIQIKNPKTEKIIKQKYKELIYELNKCETIEEKFKIYKLIRINTQQYIISLLENDSENKKEIEAAKSLEKMLPNTQEELETTDEKMIIEKIEILILKEEIYG